MAKSASSQSSLPTNLPVAGSAGIASSGGAIHLLLIEAAALGDDFSVSQILSERLLTVEDAAKPDLRLNSTYFGLTALHRAKTPEVARELLEFGVPINCRGPLGQTPLHTCCDNPPVLKLLLERGADLTAATNDGSTALEWAVVSDCVESVKLLLEKGANVQSKNNNGNTPLHLVSSRKMTELLLSFGAKVSVENNEGKIPLETAAERKGEPDFAAITELLLDVSEDRGLRYRASKPASRHILQHAKDSFGDKNDSRANVRRRWAMVREKFLHRAESTTTNSGRGRAGSVVKEWHNDDAGSGSFYGAASVDLDSGKSLPRDIGSRLSDIGSYAEQDMVGDEVESTDNRPDPNEHSGFYKKFFELAIQERPFLAKKMLDRHRTFLYAKGTAKYYLYDFSLLGGVDTTSNALRMIVECDRRELVAHDVVQWLVTAKWGLFTQQYVIIESAAYCVFIFFFVLSTLKADFPPIVAQNRGFIDFVLFCLSVRYLFRLLLEWHQRGMTKKVALSIFLADKFTGPVFVIVNIILFLRYFESMEENSNTERVLETIGSVMLWVRVLYFAEAQFQSVGLTMSIVRRMIADITVYVLVQVVFLIGFAHAMTIAFRGSGPKENKNFMTPFASFATLGFFIFNMDQEVVFDEPDPQRRTLAMILLAIYESLVVVLFLNLVIAVMTTSFENVMSNAKSEWLLVRAKICVRMEDQTSATLCTTRTQRHVRRMKAKRTAIVMERASGENEVSLPISFLPPPFRITATTREMCARLRAWFWPSPQEEEEELPITESSRAAPASYGTLPSIHTVASGSSQLSATRVKKQSSESVVDAITGQGEEVFCVGTFTRFSVLNPTAAVGSSAQAVASTTPTIGSAGESGEADVATVRDTAILRDDQLIKSLKVILHELERRNLGKAS